MIYLNFIMKNYKMVKKCLEIGCDKRPSFNNENEKKALYCNDHKLDGMINVKDKTCEQKECKTRPNFNYEGEKKGRFCTEHKLYGMIDVKSKTCEHIDCKIQPNFNYEGEKKGRFCNKHKLNGMIDVKNKTCEYIDCKIQPSCNYEGERKRRFCNKHKLDGMVDVKHKRCKTFMCPTIVDNFKYDGYCLFCFIHMFPYNPLVRNYKTKERAVVDFIKENFPEFIWTPDKVISDGCSNKRPDLILDLGYQIIIIEIDENQHRSYDCSCENKRLMELSQDVGHRPIIFIRFNPDSYMNNDEKISSCWTVNKKGICVVKKSKKDEWNERLESLKEHVNYWLIDDNKTDKTVEVIELFYDI
jgi:EsV-1-7 cysteine-rich motif